MFKITKLTKIVIFAVVFSLFVTFGALSVNYLYAAWQGPLAEPADPNVSAPIHTGGFQTKTGGLRVDGGLLSNALSAINYVGSKLTLGDDVNLEADDDLTIESDDYVRIQGGTSSARIYVDPAYSGVKVNNKLCLNGWDKCISNWSEIAGIQSCEDVSCGVDACSDCNSLFVKKSGDSMTGQLTVNEKIVTNFQIFGKSFLDNDNPDYYVDPSNPENAGVLNGPLNLPVLCLSGDCKSSWSAGVGSCTDCDSRFVKKSGDTIDGILKVTTEVQSSKFVDSDAGLNVIDPSNNGISAILAGDIIADNNTPSSCEWVYTDSADKLCPAGKILNGIGYGSGDVVNKIHCCEL